ncbi:MAG: GGDEF domain-containing protein [Dehalococcoidia bacterium]
MTDRKNIEEQLVRQSVTDALTNLPNRTRLIERLNEAIAHARRIREADAGPAVLFLDLDGFKHINDSLGHTVGDQVLVTIARRIAASIRPEDTVARFGGDEFVILLSGHVTAETATRIAERVQAVIQEPVTAQGRRLRLTASIGIALIGGDGRRPPTICCARRTRRCTAPRLRAPATSPFSTRRCTPAP